MSSEQKSQVRRILLKISGEALSGDTGFGIDPHVYHRQQKLSVMFKNREFRLYL